MTEKDGKIRERGESENEGREERKRKRKWLTTGEERN